MLLGTLHLWRVGCQQVDVVAASTETLKPPQNEASDAKSWGHIDRICHECSIKPPKLCSYLYLLLSLLATQMGRNGILSWRACQFEAVVSPMSRRLQIQHALRERLGWPKLLTQHMRMNGWLEGAVVQVQQLQGFVFCPEDSKVPGQPRSHAQSIYG